MLPWDTLDWSSSDNGARSEKAPQHPLTRINKFAEDDISGDLEVLKRKISSLDNQLGVASALGLGSELELYICVQFAWLIMPITLWALTTVNHIVTILIAWRKDAPVWKSSLLAALQCEKDNSTVSSIREIKSTAAHEPAQLLANENGWWLRREINVRSPNR